MTGIPSSNTIFRLATVFALITAAEVRGDQITLSGEDKLSGIIRSINEAGLVELTSTLSPEPILLKADAVRRVEFTPPMEAVSGAGAVVELVNGDLLPGVIEGFDDTTLTIATLDVGVLRIPRSSLSSVQLGVHRRKVIYSGPSNLDEWMTDSTRTRNWRYEGNALVANGAAYAARRLELPKQFIFRFTLKWQGNPSFQIFFADDLSPRESAANRYYFQFGAAGMELKRESTAGNRFTTIILSNRTPDQFAGNKMEVEIRVDRKSSRMQLYLNGEQEGAGIDPVPGPPEGGGVALVSNSANGNEQEVRGIEVLEYDDTRVRHRSEDRGNPKMDSLISRDDDRWGGHLLEARKRDEGMVFRFKSDFQDEPLELLEGDVSTIFFGGAEAGEGGGAASPQNPFVLQLRENGRLRVASCAFSAEAVTASHPLLGELTLARGGVVSLERVKPQVEESGK